MAKKRSHKKTTAEKPTRRSARVDKSTVAPAQKGLKDENGPIAATDHDRYADVDRLAKKMFNARDEAAIQDEKRKDALDSMQIKLSDHGHKGPYFYDHSGSKFRIEVTKKETLSVAKVKKSEFEN